MPCKYTVVLSYKEFRRKYQPGQVLESHNYDKVLPLMTHIFRINFWSVFSKVQIFSAKKRENCEIYGKNAHISNIFVCYSSEKKSDRVEFLDYIVAVVFTLDCDSSELKNATKTKTHYDRENHVREVIEYCYGTGFMSAFSSDIPGYSAHITEEENIICDENNALVSSFFHYGWIMLLRLARDQLSININPNDKKILYSSFDIINQRVHLINIKRRFLSYDRTNHRALQELCNRLRQKYKMDYHFENLNTIHEFFEHHLDNSSKIMQLRKTRSVSSVLNILTFSAIPLGVMAIILAIDLSASIFQEPERVFQMRTLYMIMIVSFLVPAALIGLAKIIDIIRYYVECDTK